MHILTKISLYLIFINCLSCAEFIEYPLEEEHIDLLAPSDNYTSTDTLINFWWSLHEDAKYYRLQLARPDFEQTDILYMDTVVHGDHVLLHVDKGSYQWRVRPENDGSVGQYRVRKLVVQAAP